MLGYAAMMQGQRQKATRAFVDMLSDIPDAFVRTNGSTIDGLFAMPYELHLRFGEWDEMLAEPQPSERFPITKSLWHLARAVAFAAKDNVTQAKAEQKDFWRARTMVPGDADFRTVRAADLLEIADKMLKGEILYRQNKIDEALTNLRQAVQLEDNLVYAEPPNWIIPVRHALGATLMDAGRYGEAETVYREDLARHPENGWSLFGLAQSLRMRGKKCEATAVAARFERVWQYADFELRSSCCCLPTRDRHSNKETHN
jgi:tetratricopeptide (TPR) repeat protein